MSNLTEIMSTYYRGPPAEPPSHRIDRPHRWMAIRFLFRAYRFAQRYVPSSRSTFIPFGDKGPLTEADSYAHTRARYCVKQVMFVC
jgi:hypothetical protein